MPPTDPGVQIERLPFRCMATSRYFHFPLRHRTKRVSTRNNYKLPTSSLLSLHLYQMKPLETWMVNMTTDFFYIPLFRWRFVYSKKHLPIKHIVFTHTHTLKCAKVGFVQWNSSLTFPHGTIKNARYWRSVLVEKQPSKQSLLNNILVVLRVLKYPHVLNVSLQNDDIY